MDNQNKTSFDLNFNGYKIRLKSAFGGYIIKCFDMTEKKRIYRTSICDLEELFWALDEIEACIEVHENMLAETKTEHPPEVLTRAQVLAKHGIKGALGAAYAGRPMRPS